jgi:hypothetical protein
MGIIEMENGTRIAILENCSEVKMNVDFGSKESISVTHEFYGVAKISETEKEQLIELCKKGDELNSCMKGK